MKTLRNLINFDKQLFSIVLGLSFIGILFVYSSSTDNYGTDMDYVIKQFLWMMVGLVAIGLILMVDYKILFDWAYVIYGISIVLLFLLLIIGKARAGAQRWFEIGGITIQPSEFVKLTFIIALAKFLTKNKYEINLKTIFYAFLIASPALLLIFKQPDLGTALILVPILLIMLFIAGMNIKVLFKIVFGGILITPIMWHFLKDYQRKRLLVFLDPNVDPLGSGYTMIQSKIAIGSGKLFGKGWLSGTQSRLNFIPERHTDFIFSVVGEEWGYVGVLLVLILFLVLIRKAISVSETTEEDFGRFIAAGIGSLFMIQVVMNIGMNAGLMPVVGVPLPFISYGGSSLLTSFVAVGLLLNIKMRRSIF